jgi:hypothetical protein
MRTLYKVLSSYIFCNTGSEQTQIAGRLRLALESGAEGDPPAFDLMFLAHPHHELQEEAFRWRETRIAVDRRYGNPPHLRLRLTKTQEGQICCRW